MLIAPGRDAPGSTSFEDTYIGCGKSILTTKHFEDGGKFFRTYGAQEPDFPEVPHPTLPQFPGTNQPENQGRAPEG